MLSRNRLEIKNTIDTSGNPAGGSVTGTGLVINWQPKPLGIPTELASGAFVEDVIEAARQRIEFYQMANRGAVACRENALAITKLEEALMWLTKRRVEREARGVQGTNNP